MNLRKLLCGLLALCLLLTMAPAALMEEAPVEEVVVELGGEEVAAVEEAPEEIAGETLEADDFYSESFAEAKGELSLPTNKKELGGTTWLEVGKELTIAVDKNYIIDNVTSKNTRIATAEDAGAVITVTGVSAGTAVINVKLAAANNIKRTTTFNVNVKVYDSDKPAAIDLYTANANTKIVDLSSNTLVFDMMWAKPWILSAEGADEDAEVYQGYPVAASVMPVGGEVYWTTSNKKVAVPYFDVTWNPIPETAGEEGNGNNAAELVEYIEGYQDQGEEDVTADTYFNCIVPKGKGTATITAKCGSVSASFKVKVTDDYAPKSISLKAEKTTINMAADPDALFLGDEETHGDLYELWTVVSPRPYWDSPVNFTLDSTKYVKFVVTDEDATKYVLSDAKSIDFADGKCYIAGVGEGTAKITAKTYNGKKSSIKIKVVNPYKPASIAIEGFYKGEKATTELYNEDWTTDVTDPQKNAFVLVPELEDGNKNAIQPTAAAAYEYANIKWTSSNKKVAKVGVFKNWDGYFNDQEVFDFWGNSFFEDEDTDDMNYAALVEIVGTGTTKITAKTRDGKKSFSITLKVVNSHKSTGIHVSSIGTIPVGESVDLNEFVRIDPADFYGTYTIKPSHATSKIDTIGDTEYIGNKAGTYTFKVKTSDGRSKSFKVKFA